MLPILSLRTKRSDSRTGASTMRQRMNDSERYLPKFIKSEEILVKVSGYILEDCVTYDARDAVLPYFGPGRCAQGVVKVSVRGPNFEFDDIFLVFNGYKSPPPGASPSPFNANVQ